MIKIALVGNPNCGKTLLFNRITGSNQYVGNWAGVTVEKKEGRIDGENDVIMTDLPGIYSLSPYTPEELVARNYLVNEKPDAILNVVDGTNIERNLYLTTQVCEMGVPVVMAINMMDVVRKNGDEIHPDEIAEHFGCTVFEISALKGTGVKRAVKRVIELARSNTGIPPVHHSFDDRVESVIHHISSLLPGTIDPRKRRFYATKIFERDEEVLKDVPMPPGAEEAIERCEKYYDDSSDGIIADQRYRYITSVIGECVTKNKTKKSTTQKIDDIVTNRFLALPIFAVIMFCVYYISVSLVGGVVTDFITTGIFGDQGYLTVPVVDLLTRVHCAEPVISLVRDGIFAGVGTVLGFVPQLFVLFAFLAFLEDCGYMSRIAFILDKLFRKFGLSGKSFIPILVGTGCGVPGTMASRTIENDKDRKMTVITTTFIPCGAKLPVISLISSTLFGGDWWFAPCAYFIGIFAIVLSGAMLKKTRPFLSGDTPFVMELPAYHMPTAKNVLKSMWERGADYLRRAGSTILLASIAVWFLSSFGIEGSRFVMVENMDRSILAYAGRVLAVVFAPLGFGEWQASVATLMGLLAKEGIVSVLGVLTPDVSQIFTPLSGFSFLVFNLLCLPCVAAITAMWRELQSPAWFTFAVLYRTLFAYAVSFCIYHLGLLFTTGAFSVSTGIACLIVLFFVFMLVRRPSKPRPKKAQTGKAAV